MRLQLFFLVQRGASKSMSPAGRRGQASWLQMLHVDSGTNQGQSTMYLDDHHGSALSVPHRYEQ